MDMQDYLRELSLYGAGLTEDARIITPSGKTTGVQLVEKKGRLRFENKSTGHLIASYPARHGSVGAFVETYWFWSVK